jgi:antitoxin PrlF
MSELSEMWLGITPKVEAIVSVDERGQMVLPKEVRTKANINAGDKLALMSLSKGNKTVFLVLLKSELFEAHVKESLGPVMKELIK